ncbi:MAG: hypothetical protein ACI8RE_002646 [Ilumatobacter sp.]|jgi:hypothetical protein
MRSARWCRGASWRKLSRALLLLRIGRGRSVLRWFVVAVLLLRRLLATGSRPT